MHENKNINKNLQASGKGGSDTARDSGNSLGPRHDRVDPTDWSLLTTSLQQMAATLARLEDSTQGNSKAIQELREESAKLRVDLREENVKLRDELHGEFQREFTSLKDGIGTLQRTVGFLRNRVSDMDALNKSVSLASRFGSIGAYSSDTAPRGSAFRESPRDYKPRSPFSQ